MSNLVEHARKELELLGQFDEDPAYSQSILAAVAAFASYGHSGGSAGCAIEQLTRLLRHEALSPLTTDPQEWRDVEGPGSDPTLWQNMRDSRALSTDQGRTYWLVDDEGKTIHESRSWDGGAEAITLTAEQAEALSEGEPVDGYEFVGNQEDDSGRWYRNMVLVIRRVGDGRLFGVDYQLGLTENQDPDIPWNGCGSEDPIEFREMFATRSSTVEYVYRGNAEQPAAKDW